MINLMNILFSLGMGFLMSVSITLATTFVRVGPVENFFFVWLEVWLVAYPVAIVCILIYRPFASRLTAVLFEKITASK